MPWLVVAAVLGALAVGLGAYGAHGLVAQVGPEKVAAWRTAAHLQLVHSAVIMALALFGLATQKSVAVQETLFTAGILFFAGSIYVLVLGGGPSWLGMVTPLGGITLMAAWLSLILLLR